MKKKKRPHISSLQLNNFYHSFEHTDSYTEYDVLAHGGMIDDDEDFLNFEEQIVGKLEVVVLADDANYEDICELHEAADAFRDIVLTQEMDGLVDGLGYGVLYLDKIQIDKEFRGFNLGLHMIAYALRILGHCSYALMLPCPINEDNEKKRKAGAKKLAKYYSQIGFEPVPNHEKYMFLDLAMKLPKLPPCDFL